MLCALLASYPSATGVGIDRSMDACLAARASLEACGLADRANIARCDWTAPLRGAFDLVVSNPPYIRTGDLAGLPDEVRRHDPKLALDGGVDGFDSCRAILADISRLLKPNALLVLEIGAGMRESIEEMLPAAGLAFHGLEHDAGGHVRAVAAAPL